MDKKLRDIWADNALAGYEKTRPIYPKLQRGQFSIFLTYVSQDENVFKKRVTRDNFFSKEVKPILMTAIQKRLDNESQKRHPSPRVLKVGEELSKSYDKGFEILPEPSGAEPSSTQKRQVLSGHALK